MAVFKQIPFRNLEPGEPFLVPNKTDKRLQLFLKLEVQETEVSIMGNSVDLQTGALYDMPDNFQVITCDGHIKVVLETKQDV